MYSYSWGVCGTLKYENASTCERVARSRYDSKLRSVGANAWALVGCDRTLFFPNAPPSRGLLENAQGGCNPKSYKIQVLTLIPQNLDPPLTEHTF